MLEEQLLHEGVLVVNLGDLYAESGQTLQGSFSAVLKPNFASKYALESSRRDLHNALLCTALQPQRCQKIAEFFAKVLRNSAKLATVGCLSSFCSRNSARFEFSKEVLNIFRRLLPCPSKLFRKAFMVTHVVFNSVIHSRNVSGNIGLGCIHQMQSFGCIVVCM